MSLLILDCSHYQPRLDIAAFKAAGVVGVVHKATQYVANPQVDATYFTHRDQCLAAGLLWGAYLFFDARVDGVTQADFFLDTVKPDANTLLAVDLEEAGVTLVEVEKCINRLHAKTGNWGWVYTAEYEVDRIGGHKSNVLANTRLWVAGNGPVIPSPWVHWDLWQSHYMDFAGETFDANEFRGTLDELKAIWGSGMSMPLSDAKVVSLNELETHAGPSLSEPVNGTATVGQSYPVNTANATEDAANKGTIMYEIMPEHWLNGKYLQFADNTNPTPAPLPGPTPVSKVTTATINLRSAPVVDNADVKLSKNILAQIPSGITIQVTPPALTTANHFILTAYHDAKSGNTYSGWASSDYMRDPQ